MIRLMSLLALMSTLAGAHFALAEETIVLSTKKIILNEPEAILVRTSDTPKKLKLEVPVRTGNTYCSAYDTRMVYGVDPSCGYETRWQYECRSFCVRHTPQGNCSEYARRCDTYPYNVMRACEHPETYCARHDVAYHLEPSKVRIWFDNLPELRAGETERFRLKGEGAVDSGKEYYTLEVLDSKVPYSVKVSWKLFFGDTIVVKRR